jgi:hypothetical protein
MAESLEDQNFRTFVQRRAFCRVATGHVFPITLHGDNGDRWGGSMQQATVTERSHGGDRRSETGIEWTIG